MISRTLTISTVAGAVSLSWSANAAYLGLSLESTDSYFSNHPNVAVRDAWNAGPVNQYDIYRLYADFDTNTVDDRIVTVGGISDSPLSVTVIGGTFYNYTMLFKGDPMHFALPGLSPPQRAWDTYVTIGDAIDGGNTALTPGFDIETNNLGANTSIIGPTNNVGWGVGTPTAPQSLAVATAPGQQDAPPGIYRVLLAQFTVTQGTQAVIGNAWVNVNFVNMYNQTFAIPAPGALALLAVGIFANRRRRT